MSPLQAALLGLVQGITEFLPISSEAHLILTSRLFGWEDQGLLFDMAAHVGSLLAVLVYFRTDLARLSRALVRSVSAAQRHTPAARLAGRILLATIPVGIAGLLLQTTVAGLGRSTILIAFTSIVFGLLLGWADRRPERHPDLARLTLGGAVAVGLAQALALAPGTSRSGVTITAGRWLGFSREEATRFSFLLAVPVGLLVAGKQAYDLLGTAPGDFDGVSLTIGFVVSALSAYLAIHWLLSWVRRQSLMAFVVYRCLLGALILGLAAASWA